MYIRFDRIDLSVQMIHLITINACIDLAIICLDPNWSDQVSSEVFGEARSVRVDFGATEVTTMIPLVDQR